MHDCPLHDSLARQFATAFGSPPEIIVRAPGRLNLIGEHTDYNAGFVLPAAINRAIWFAAGKRADGWFDFRAADLADRFFADGQRIEKSEKGWANYLLGVLSEARKDGHQTGGLNIVFGGDVPLGAGLSSSAAVESGMIFVANRLFNLGLEKMEMVRLAQRGENRFVGMNCGIMDMFASVMGRRNSVIRLDCRSLEFDYFPFENPDFVLILVNSGVKHALVESEYNTRRAECEAGVRLLKTRFPEVQTLRDASPSLLSEAREAGLFSGNETVFNRCLFVSEENERVVKACNALKINDLETVGQLMFASHAGLRDLYEVSCPELDLLIESARFFPPSGGLKGARMMGGGFGGCTINLVRRAAMTDFLSHVNAVFHEKYGRQPESHVVELSDGVGEDPIQPIDFQPVNRKK